MVQSMSNISWRHQAVTPYESDFMIFRFVVQSKSFTGAAKLLGVSRSLVSKRISRLEERLQARLLNRSTRSLSLTAAGQALYTRCKNLSDEIHRIEREIRDFSSDRSGFVRLAAPKICSYISMPIFSELSAKYPGINVELVVTDTSDEIDIIGNGYDAAVKLGDLDSSNLIARKFSEARYVICAAPEYFDEFGRPETPDDLRHLNCITCTDRPNGDQWYFREPDSKPFNVSVTGDFQTNCELMILGAIQHGRGVARLPDVLVQHEVENGKLERVLKNYSHLHNNVYIVYPHRDMPDSVRLVVDFLLKRVQEQFGPDTRH